MKKIKQFFTLLMIAAVFIGTVTASPRTAYAGLKEESDFEPAIFGKITNQTDKVRIYVYDDSTLKIRNESETIFEKTYQHEGKKTISFSPQKANTKLEFILTTKDGLLCYAERTVKDDGVISQKEKDPSAKKPIVAGEITDKSTSLVVYANKGETLYIQNGAKVIRKVTYKRSGYQDVSIKKQKAETKLTLYTATEKGRSAYLTKEVLDVTPPKKPKVSYNIHSCDKLIVQGERNCNVYVRRNSHRKTGKWKYLGVLDGTKKSVFYIDILPEIKTMKAGDTLSVRLVDDAGNKSEIVTTKAVKEDWYSLLGD